MGRYRRKPGNGDLDHFHAVEDLATRLARALADWPRYQAFNGNALEVLRDALLVTLGPQTFHQITTLAIPNQLNQPRTRSGHQHQQQEIENG